LDANGLVDMEALEGAQIYWYIPKMGTAILPSQYFNSWDFNKLNSNEFGNDYWCYYKTIRATDTKFDEFPYQISSVY
jgi:hypothetical protein